jgi:hypothetical protein
MAGYGIPPERLRVLTLTPEAFNKTIATSRCWIGKANAKESILRARAALVVTQY